MKVNSEGNLSDRVILDIDYNELNQSSIIYNNEV